MEAGLMVAELFAFVAIAIAIVAYLLRFGLSHLYDVAIGAEGLHVVLFRKVIVATIPYSSIERAERRWIFLSVDHSAPWSIALPLTNRVGLQSVIIKPKRRIGVFRHIAVKKTPCAFWKSFGQLSSTSHRCKRHARVLGTLRRFAEL